ncbi:MAG: hypothetical protein Q9165_001891 [Trypethelium subeluteriae]
MGDAPLPSSFDSNPDFYEENRWQKLSRRLKEEPLIPLGCALTCWALFGATRSMRVGDHNLTNRFFRRRIYAQGFTIAVMFVGSVYWEGDRAKRKEYDTAVQEQKAREKRDAWLRELEVRDEEDKAIRARKEAKRKRDTERAEKEAAKRETEVDGLLQGEEAGGESSVTQAVKRLAQGETEVPSESSGSRDEAENSDREGSVTQMVKDLGEKR